MESCLNLKKKAGKTRQFFWHELTLRVPCNTIWDLKTKFTMYFWSGNSNFVMFMWNCIHIFQFLDFHRKPGKTRHFFGMNSLLVSLTTQFEASKNFFFWKTCLRISISAAISRFLARRPKFKVSIYLTIPGFQNPAKTSKFSPAEEKKFERSYQGSLSLSLSPPTHQYWLVSIC